MDFEKTPAPTPPFDAATDAAPRTSDEVFGQGFAPPPHIYPATDCVSPTSSRVFGNLFLPVPLPTPLDAVSPTSSNGQVFSNATDAVSPTSNKVFGQGFAPPPHFDAADVATSPA